MSDSVAKFSDLVKLPDSFDVGGFVIGIDCAADVLKNVVGVLNEYQAETATNDEALYGVRSAIEVMETLYDMRAQLSLPSFDSEYSPEDAQHGRSLKISLQESRMYKALRDCNVKNDKLLFDIDAHKMCAQTWLNQARESYKVIGDEGIHLQHASEHIDRIEQFVKFYSSEE